MPKKTKNKYNHYTEDFRREAVRRSEDPNASAAEVAKELGIHPGQIENIRQACIKKSKFFVVSALKPTYFPSYFSTGFF